MKKDDKPKLRKLEEEEEVIKLGQDLEGEEGEIERLLVNPDELNSDRKQLEEIDNLFSEEDNLPDAEVDLLFKEEKSTRHDPLEKSISKALHERKVSRSFTDKSGKMNHQTLEEIQLNQDEEEERGWGEETEEHKKSNVRYVFIGLFVVILVVGGWGGMKLSQKKNVPTHVETKRAELAEKDEQKKELKRTIAGLKHFFREFNNAKVGDKINSIVDGDILRQEIMHSYSSGKIPETYEIEKIDHIAEQELSGKKIWMIGFYHREVKLHYETVFLEEVEAGKFKIEWRALSGYNDRDWKDFIAKQKKDAEVFRFRISRPKVRYFNWSFKDSTHEVLRMEVEGDEKSYWGYVDKENREVLVRLQQILRKSNFAKKTLGVAFDEVILKVRFPHDSPVENTNSMIIDEIISSSWVAPRE